MLKWVKGSEFGDQVFGKFRILYIWMNFGDDFGLYKLPNPQPDFLNDNFDTFYSLVR